MVKNIYEVWDEFKKAKNKEERKEVLRKNDSETLRIVIQGAMHPAIQYVFDSPAPYKPSDAPPGMGYMNMEGAVKKIYLYVKGSKRVDPNVSQSRKENLFIQLLESMEAPESEVLMNMVLKDLKVKGLTPELVKEVWPGILPD